MFTYSADPEACARNISWHIRDRSAFFSRIYPGDLNQAEVIRNLTVLTMPAELQIATKVARGVPASDPLIAADIDGYLLGIGPATARIILEASIDDLEQTLSRYRIRVRARHLGGAGLVVSDGYPANTKNSVTIPYCDIPKLMAEPQRRYD